jgi:hypothetical protein
LYNIKCFFWVKMASNFRIIQSEDQISMLYPGWQNMEGSFDRKGEIVDCNGNPVDEKFTALKYKIDARIERQFSCVERIIHIALGILVVLGTFFLGLFSPSVQELFTKDREVCYLGTLNPKPMTPSQCKLYDEIRKELSQHPEIKNPVLNVKENYWEQNLSIEDVNVVAQKLLYSDHLIKGFGSYRTISKVYSICEGWYEPTEPAFSDILLNRTPQDIKNLENFCIIEQKDFVLAHQYFEIRRYKSPENIINLIQNIATAALVRQMEPAVLALLLNQRQINPNEIEELLKLFSDSKQFLNTKPNLDSFRIMSYFLGHQPVFKKNEIKCFSFVEKLKDILFITQSVNL